MWGGKMTDMNSDNEYVIQESSSKWGVLRSNSSTRSPLILTNKRIIFGDKTNFINLNEILNIEIDTHIIEAPTITLRVNNVFETISFVRLTSDQLPTILLGDTGWVQTELATYTSYWASLITTAKSQSGARVTLEDYELMRTPAPVVPVKNTAWCGNCKKYLEIDSNPEIPIWSTKCPECGGFLLSQSLEDREMNPINPEDLPGGNQGYVSANISSNWWGKFLLSFFVTIFILWAVLHFFGIY
jgi:hypothetical protein